MVLFDVNGGPFRFYEMVMKAYGIWPLHRNQRQSTIVFSITALTQIVIAVTCLLHPLKECLPHNLRNMHSTHIGLTITEILSQTNFRVFGRSLIPLIEETIADWSTITVPKERDILERHNRAGRFLFYSLFGWSITGFLLYVKYMPFTDEFIFMEKREPCAFNDDIIASNLLPILSLISGTVGKAINLSGFMLFWSLAMHLSARFKILKEQFEDFLLIKVKTAQREELRRLVDIHNHLLGLSRHLENSFTVFVTIAIVNHQILICTLTFWIVITPELIFSAEGFHTFAVMMSLSGLVFVYYYAGDYLSASSGEIGDVFTQCNWYNLSKESIKEYSIIIARCQKPCTFSCVKMYQLNLSNLRYVFEAMYSYVMCIVAVVKTTQK